MTQLLIMMAQLEDEKGNTLKALEILKKAKEIDPEDPIIYFYEGVFYDKLNEWDKAEKSLLKAIELRPRFPDALNYLGYSYINRDLAVDKGIQLVKKALSLVPDSPAYIDSLAWGYFKKGDYQKALELIEKAYRMLPDDPVLNEHYAEILEALGRKKEALKYYKKALKIINETGEEGEPGLKEKIIMNRAVHSSLKR